MTSSDFYTCTYSRATTYYIGACVGVIVGVLIMLVDVSHAWRYGLIIGAVAFFGGSALYYDVTNKTQKRGDDEKQPEQ
jgi:hypothetical protein